MTPRRLAFLLPAALLAACFSKGDGNDEDNSTAGWGAGGSADDGSSDDPFGGGSGGGDGTDGSDGADGGDGADGADGGDGGSDGGDGGMSLDSFLADFGRSACIWIDACFGLEALGFGSLDECIENPELIGLGAFEGCDLDAAAARICIDALEDAIDSGDCNPDTILGEACNPDTVCN